MSAYVISANEDTPVSDIAALLEHHRTAGRVTASLSFAGYSCAKLDTSAVTVAILRERLGTRP
jgi:hypothetical protein